jgi:hypothetical protein
MLDRRSGLRGWLGILSLASLVLVPLALNEHRHADDMSAARPCAVCVVAHHAPLASVPIAVGVTLALAGVVTHLTPVVAPTVHHRSPAAGRAPPFARVVLEA